VGQRFEFKVHQPLRSEADHFAKNVGIRGLLEQRKSMVDVVIGGSMVWVVYRNQTFPGTRNDNRATLDLQALLEKSTDTDFLREMLGFTPQHLMDWKSRAGPARRTAAAAPTPEAAQRISRPHLGNLRRHGRTAHPEAL
jgi:hypothetical protein